MSVRGALFGPLLLALALVGCAASRHAEAPHLARAAGWRWQILSAGRFDLATASSRREGGETLTAYIEGDGLAYVRPDRPALDPTPTDPVALRLALADPGTGPIAWIARPCQYTMPARGRGCNSAEWLTRRYAPEILESIDDALDVLKQESGARRLVLVGYSGGGAIAVLLAARRTDVEEIVTVAADLDLGYWIHRDGLSPLTGSLDPADVATQVRKIPQVAFTGSDDRVVGTDVARAYVSHLPPGAPIRLIEVPGFTHDCCWARDWASLLRAARLRP